MFVSLGTKKLKMPLRTWKNKILFNPTNKLFK